MRQLDKRLVRTERFAWRVIEDEAVLIDRDEEEVLRLNSIATEIWQALDGSRSIEEIINQIHHGFDVNRKTAENDVLRFVKELLKREMVDEVPAAVSEPEERS
jgi:coenzyme PQQ biosynthesis protein PqqD